MCDFGTPVGSYLSNMSEGSDPYNDQQRHISFGYLTLKQPLSMLISKNKFLQPMPRSPLYESKSGGTSPWILSWRIRPLWLYWSLLRLAKLCQALLGLPKPEQPSEGSSAATGHRKLP